MKTRALSHNRSTSIFLFDVVNFPPVSSPLHFPSLVVFPLILLFFLFFLHVAMVLKTNPESCEYQAIALSHSAASPSQWVHFNVCVGKKYSIHINERKKGRRKREGEGSKEIRKEEKRQKAGILGVFSILFSFF